MKQHLKIAIKETCRMIADATCAGLTASFKAARIVAAASNGNPLKSTGLVILFVFGINLLFAVVETLIWGEMFQHWLDVVLLVASIVFSGMAAYECAVYNNKNN